MNFILHTMAAHRHLLARPEARPHHVSLYWALFFAWNAERFPHELPLNRQDIMQAAHIGNKDTYLSAMRDLSTWGLLTYQPSHSGGSTARLQVLDGMTEVCPEVGKPKPASRPRSGPTQPAPVCPEVGQQSAQKWANPGGEVGPEVGRHSLYNKTGSTNSENTGTAAPQKKIEVLEGEGHSGVEMFDDTALPSGAGPAQPAAPKKKVALKKKGVQAAAIHIAATAPRNDVRRGRTALHELPFSQSPIADVSAFIQAFQGTDYELADLRHYHQLVATWRDKKTGLEPTRKDWVATAKRFMLNDAADNRLKLAPNVQRRPDGSLHQQPPAGDLFAATGFKSKYDR
ncbi:hypothetical protein FY528_05370 [Hymenobacter lutimineralis]|uniref:Uncharacterized protein n=1 Tax=Hymenobacter lutimineralis TaxID=2606448 RepID=A0A5D6VBL0_9BACT|nr:hypothetical protein [Hymenobacter lutimineralis]TYZ12720.1 hypothetical protein FY528_05370 [Hymenobacter lutimineralis]